MKVRAELALLSGRKSTFAEATRESDAQGATDPVTWRTRVWAGATERPVIVAASVAALARAVSIVIVARLDLIPRLAPDTYYFVEMATRWADIGVDGARFDDVAFDQVRTFIIPLGLIFKVTGPSVVWAQIVAAVFGAATVAIVAHLLSREVGRSCGLVGGLIAALVPSQVLWSSVGLRDSAIWAVTGCIALLVAFAWKATRGPLVATGLGIALLLVLLGNLRLPSLLIAAWALVIIALLSPGRAVRAERIAGALVLAGVIPAMFGGGAFGWSAVANNEDLTSLRTVNAVGADTRLVDSWTPGDEHAANLGLERGEIVEILPPSAQPAEPDRAGADEGGGEPAEAPPPPGYSTVEEEGFTDQVRYLPRGLTVMLLEPLPWTSFSGTHVRIAQLETIVWYPLLALAVIGTYAAARRRVWGLMFPALVAAGLLVVYALVEGSFGTAYRHRGEIVWIVAVFAAVGLDHLERRRGVRHVASRARAGL